MTSTGGDYGGNVQGQMIVDYWTANPDMDKNGDGKLQMMIIMGDPGHTDAQPQVDSVKATIEDAGIGIEVLKEDTGMWDTAKAKEKIDAWISKYEDEVDILACRRHTALARRAAEESMVLLKNEGKALPLGKERTEKIVVLGVLGDIENIGDHGSSKVHPHYTVTYREEDYPYFDPDCAEIEYGYYHGYFKMEKEGREVLYPFGYGLSYTSFFFGDPRAEVFRGVAKISVAVKNTGSVRGTELVQLYVGCRESAVDRPVKVLRDFARVTLEPGEETRVFLTVSKDSMAYFDEEKDDFVTKEIRYIGYIGGSSRESDLEKVEFEYRTEA